MSYVGGADNEQRGEAGRIRGGEVSKEDYSTLSKIVHSSDTHGRWANTPNEYRDTSHSSVSTDKNFFFHKGFELKPKDGSTAKYDEKAQQTLNNLGNKYNK
jgi:hypothetical protein